jgi:two-component system CheB/CheR fusion protein
MAVELWGLRAEEVEGRPLTSLDIGLPVQSLEDPLARAFAGDVARIEERIEAVNRRGRAFECLVRIMPLTTRAGETYGVLVLMGETPAEELADM